MKLSIPKEWLLNKVSLEEGMEIGAGSPIKDSLQPNPNQPKMSNISEQAKRAAKAILEYDSIVLPVSALFPAIANDIQSAIDSATKPKDGRIRELEGKLEKAEYVLRRYAGEGFNRAKFYFDEFYPDKPDNEQSLEQKGGE